VNICHFIASQGLGRGEFYIDLVNEMANDKKLELYLLIPKNAKFLPRVSSRVKVIEYQSKDSRNNPFLYIELLKIFKLNCFDIVHTHFAKSTEIFYRLNKILNIPHVATKHNPRKGKIFNKIKYVTAVSKDVKDSIKNENIELIFNGINPMKIKKIEKNEIFTIRAIGRLDKIKGFDKLIKEFSNFKSDAVLEIIGDGEEKEELNNLIKSLNLDGKVKLIGFREDIPELISSSSLVIISSLSEGFSIVALETMVYGKLLISTKVGICKEILPEILLIDNFKFADKFNDIYNNYANYCNEFKNLKLKYEEEFILKNIAEKYNKYYKKVIEIENSSY